LHERARTRRRLAALAAFCAFWAALLVTIGFPVWLVLLGYAALVVSLAVVFEGRAVAGRVEQVDLAPVRAGAGRRARDVASLTRRVSARARAAGRAAAARAGAEAGTVRARVAESRAARADHQEALALNAKAAALRHEGDLDGALEAGERALELLRRRGERRAEALTLNGIGLIQARLGDEAAAVDAYEAAIAILGELGDGHGAGRVLANLGALHLDLGQEDEARARWTDALERLEPGSPEHERTAEQLRLAG
jgi:tetratricopeptide (TPR) repeat protein